MEFSGHFDNFFIITIIYVCRCSEYSYGIFYVRFYILTGKGSLRMLVGLFGIVVSILLFKLLFKTTDKILEKLGCSVKNENETRRIPFLDLLYKYLTFSITAFHVVCSLPVLFQVLKIERPSYYNRE